MRYEALWRQELSKMVMNDSKTEAEKEELKPQGIQWPSRESQRRPCRRGPSALQETWIGTITLDRSMAATGGEQ